MKTDVFDVTLMQSLQGKGDALAVSLK